VFDDGRYQEQRIALREGAAHSVFFAAGGPVELPPERIPEPRPDRLSAGAWLGMALPVAASARTLGEGPCALAELSYDFGLRRGDVGLGLLAGAMPLSSDAHDYELLCRPVAVALRYRRPLGPRWFLAAQAAAGAALNRASFPEEELEPVSTLKFFLAPTLSAGLPLGRRFELSAGAGFLFVFFDGTPLAAISPGVRLEYALHTAKGPARRRP